MPLFITLGIKPIVSAVVSKVKSLAAQGFQKVKQGVSTAYNKVKYQMAKDKFNSADKKAKSLEANSKFNEDSAKGQALRNQHADACKSRDGAFKSMEKYAVKSGNEKDLKEFAANRTPNDSKSNPKFSQDNANTKLKDATATNNLRNEYANDPDVKAATTPESKQAAEKAFKDKATDKIEPKTNLDGKPASVKDKIKTNEDDLNKAKADKQDALNEGAKAITQKGELLNKKQKLDDKAANLNKKLEADKKLPADDKNKMNEAQKGKIEAQRNGYLAKAKELGKNNESKIKDLDSQIEGANKKIADADSNINKAQDNLNKLHANNDSDAQFSSYMSGKENAIFGDPRPGSDQIAGMAGSKAYGEYTESKVPPGSTPEQGKAIREQAGVDLQKQKDLRLNESANNLKMFNNRVDKGVAEYKADRKAAMNKAKDSSNYAKEMHHLTEAGRHANDFGQNLVTAVEHTLLASAELTLGHLKASEHILRELSGNVRNWNEKTRESYREACDLIKNIIDVMTKVIEAEKQRGFGKTYTQ